MWIRLFILHVNVSCLLIYIQNPSNISMHFIFIVLWLGVADALSLSIEKEWKKNFYTFDSKSKFEAEQLSAAGDCKKLTQKNRTISRSSLYGQKSVRYTEERMAPATTTTT